MIYIACPYWHPELKVRDSRRKIAMAYADKLTRSGVLNYSPLTYTERYANNEIPENYWIRHGLEMVKACDEMHILCVPGWRDSKGIQGELRAAKENNLKIVYKNEEET